MNHRGRVCLLALISGLALIGPMACGSQTQPVVPPYGFSVAPQQRFRLESEEKTNVEGIPVTVQRRAQFVLQGEPIEDGRFSVSLRLERYYLRVDGAPGGSSEIALSDRGLALRSGADDPIRLAPDDTRPGGGRVAELLDEPVAGCELDSQGAIRGTPWHSFDPILTGVQLLEWVLLDFPIENAGPEAIWSARRPLPALGQYRLGIDLPLHYERIESDPNGLQRVTARGEVQRQGLSLAAKLKGSLRIELQVQSDLEKDGRLRRAQLDLEMHFEAERGSLVTTTHHARLVCLDCGAVQPPSAGFR